MKIAIHQPEHFPYLGFFQKMKESDLFIILDDVQFTKGNFQHRNRFLNKNNQEEWFTISLEQKPHRKLIKDIYTLEGSWRKKIIKKINQNFKKDLSHIYEPNKLLDINLNSINYCKQNLNIETPLMLSSELNIKTTGSQKLADICDKLKATEYISGQGAKNYLDESVFGCKVTYFNPVVSNHYTTLQHI